ncbi:hypothetical protein GEMRC1_013035 [Eukaryota sp. GEM-RC1]
MSNIITGKCLDMCPVSERRNREENHQLDPLEITPGQDHQTTPQLAVKAFPRSAAGTLQQDPQLLRPLPILKRTLSHLVSLLSSSQQPVVDTCAFIFNRVRCIFQDFTVQELFIPDAIPLLEQITYTYLLLDYLLMDEDQPSSATALLYNQLNNVLHALLNIYDSLDGSSPNEMYFRSISLLSGVGNTVSQKIPSVAPDTLGEWASWTIRTGDRIKSNRDQSIFDWTVNVMRSFHSRNYFQFFSIFKQSNFFQAVLLLRTARVFRRCTLDWFHQRLIGTHKISVVSDWLAITEQSLIDLLDIVNISVNQGCFILPRQPLPPKPWQSLHFPEISSVVSSIPGERLRLIDSMLVLPFLKMIQEDCVLTVGDVLDPKYHSQQVEASISAVMPVPSPQESLRVRPTRPKPTREERFFRSGGGTSRVTGSNPRYGKKSIR